MILIGLVLSSSVFAGWKNVFTFSFGRTGMCGYFFNEFEGMIAGSTDAGIWSTTDGGTTWFQDTLPPAYAGQAFNVTQIVMLDRQNGWASVEVGIASMNGILRTTDGGLHWRPAGPPGDYSCIAATATTIVTTSRGNYGTGEVSVDGGVTWTLTNRLKYMNGLDFVDNSYGVATGFYDSTWQRTLDGGRTWINTVPPQRVESWSIYALKGTSFFFAAPEKDHNRPSNVRRGSVYASSDYGATWHIVFDSIGSTGTLAGTKGVMYVQTDTNRVINGAVRGLFRSTDLGATWVNVGGPSNTKDTRFVVTGCSGGVVYAFDPFGNVWKTNDGGNGGLPEPPIALQFDANSIDLSGPICSTTFATVRMINPYCEDDSLVSVTLVDPSSQLFTSGALSLVSAPNLPLILRPNQQDSLVFKWTPFRLFHRDTNITTQLRLHYYSRILQRFLDTVVTIHAHAIGEAPQALVQPTTLGFGPVKFCTNYDTLVTFVNRSCDTLYIESYSAAKNLGYTLTDPSGALPSFPIVLVPGDSVTLRVRLFLDVAGAYSNVLTFHLQHQGIARDTSIALSASMSAAGSYVITDSLHIRPISTCAWLDTVVLVRNFGCKPLVISGASLQKGTAFSLLGTPPYTSPIQPDSTGKVFLHFQPAGPISYDDVLTLNVVSLGEGSTISIPLHGSGFSVPAKLQSTLPLDTLFALDLTRCDSARQFTIHIDNPGCQTLDIQSVTRVPATDPNVTVSHAALPLTLTSSSSGTDIVVVARPDVLGRDSGTITIRFKLQGEAARDTTVRYYLNVGYGSRTLATSIDTIDLGTMKFCDVKDTTVLIESNGCDSLSIISIDVQGNGNFALGQPGTLNLPPNTVVPLNIHFEPTMAGPVRGLITIAAHADPDSVKFVAIVANIIPTDTLVFDLTSSKPNIFAGDTISFVMMPSQDIHNRGLQSISFVLNYNGDLLTLLTDPTFSKVLIPNAAFVANPPGGTAKHTTTKIVLQGLPFLDFTAGQPAMKLVFVARLTDSVHSTMFLSDVKLNGNDAVYAKCELGVVSVTIDYSLSLRCGDSTLIRFMQGYDISTFLLSAPIPNPVTTDNGLHVKLPFVTRIPGDLRLDIFDGLGRTVSTYSLLAGESGKYGFDVDANALPSGIYQYVLRHLGNGASVQGRFSVIR